MQRGPTVPLKREIEAKAWRAAKKVASAIVKGAARSANHELGRAQPRAEAADAASGLGVASEARSAPAALLPATPPASLSSPLFCADLQRWHDKRADVCALTLRCIELAAVPLGRRALKMSFKGLGSQSALPRCLRPRQGPKTLTNVSRAAGFA